MWTALKEFRRRRALAKPARKLRKLRIEALETHAMLATLIWAPGVGGHTSHDLFDSNNWCSTTTPRTACANLIPGGGDDLNFYDQFGPVTEKDFVAAVNSITVGGDPYPLPPGVPTRLARPPVGVLRPSSLINVLQSLDVDDGTLGIESAKPAGKVVARDVNMSMPNYPDFMAQGQTGTYSTARLRPFYRHQLRLDGARQHNLLCPKQRSLAVELTTLLGKVVSAGLTPVGRTPVGRPQSGPSRAPVA